jgi:hypothetical protein
LPGGKTLPINEGESVVDAELSESETDLESDGPKAITEANRDRYPDFYPETHSHSRRSERSEGRRGGGGIGIADPCWWLNS